MLPPSVTNVLGHLVRLPIGYDLRQLIEFSLLLIERARDYYCWACCFLRTPARYLLVLAEVPVRRVSRRAISGVGGGQYVQMTLDVGNIPIREVVTCQPVLAAVTVSVYTMVCLSRR